MSVTLYELVGRNDLRFSPYCWRTRMALAHKSIFPERLGVRYSDKEKIAFSGQGKVPVLVDHGRTIADSWNIAWHLEASYADTPSLFGGDVGRELCEFLNIWADSRLNPLLLRLVFRNLIDIVAPEDQDYFLESRLQRMDTTLEALEQQRSAVRQRVHEELQSLNAQLTRQSWFGGDRPAYADYILFGTLHWAQLASDEGLLAEQEAIRTWYALLLDMYDGEARKVFGQ